MSDFVFGTVSMVLFMYLFWEILGSESSISDKENYLKYTINKKFGSEIANGIIISFARGMNIFELMEKHWKEDPLTPLSKEYQKRIDR